MLEVHFGWGFKVHSGMVTLLTLKGPLKMNFTNHKLSGWGVAKQVTENFILYGKN